MSAEKDKGQDISSVGPSSEPITRSTIPVKRYGTLHLPSELNRDNSKSNSPSSIPRCFVLRRSKKHCMCVSSFRGVTFVAELGCEIKEIFRVSNILLTRIARQIQPWSAFSKHCRCSETSDFRTRTRTFEFVWVLIQMCPEFRSCFPRYSCRHFGLFWATF